MKNMLVEVTEAGDILVDDGPILTTGLIVYNDLLRPSVSQRWRSVRLSAAD